MKASRIGIVIPNNPTPPPTDLRTRGKVVIVLSLLVLGVISFVGGGALWFLREMYRTLPTFDQLQNIEQPLVTRVLASDNSVIHDFAVERRFQVSIDSIPQNLVNAVVATEDRRFFKHWGIDLKRIFGAIAVDLLRGHYAQGASTLTQQLARNLYLSQRQSMVRKIREALTAVKLESCYTKREILELYLNQVYLGAGVYGVEAAAQRYFSKSISECGLNECAIIAGLVQLPEYYRPDKPQNIQRTTERRNTVLRSMNIMGFIDAPVCNAAMADTIPSNPQKQNSRIAPYFVEMVRQEAVQRYGDNTLYNGGLTIYTTLDPVAQESTETAVREHLAVLQRGCNALFLDSSHAYTKLKISRSRFMENFDSVYAAHRDEYSRLPDSVKLRIAQVSVIAMDAGTGAIRTLVGGRNYAESKFNRAVQARRQPGSAMKPIVYAAAMEQGMTPATVILDQPITLVTPDGEWRPENYGRTFCGPVTIRYALAKSINLVAIQVLNKIGADKVIACARKLGLRNRMNPVPSLAIGACEVTPMELTCAYGAFANGGYLVKPYCIEKITARDGRVVYKHEVDRSEVLTPQVAYIMADMMTDVVKRGTGARIPGMGFTRPAGGKTGTTNDYSDAWFVGFTPQIVCGVWVGVDERRSLGHGVTGSRGAIPIWVPAMKALHRNLDVASFDIPGGIDVVRLCQSSNLIATKYCPETRLEHLIAGSLTDTCTIHRLNRTLRGSSAHDMFGTARKKRPSDETQKKRKLMF